ncbi:MAG: histidine phosphatase family protein [Candidatus Pacearchaeota archaeon]|jgi:broad specificity phosphatase PhoE/isopentenyldiphosphate isomerase
MKLYIVRHAQSNRNIGVHSDIDTGLSDIGYEQAKRLGIYFKKVKLDKIYCSDLKRTKDTLKEILPYVNKVPVVYTSEIREHNMGVYAENGKDDWKLYAEDAEKAGLSLFEFKPKRGESQMENYNKMGKFYQKLLKKHKNDKILIVNHSMAGRHLILNALGLDINERKYFGISNASVSVLDIDRNGKVKSYDIDDFHHIIDYALRNKSNPHNPEEIIAIVDNNDKIIGKYPRKNHAEGKLHRETSVLIINPKNEILVQERKDSGKLDYSASGHFPFNEDYLGGIVREVSEELGLKIDKSKFNKITKYRINYSSEKYINNRFITLWEVKGDYKIKDIKIDSSEVKAVRYYSIPELKEIIKENQSKLASGFKESLKIYFKKIGEK